MGRTGGTGKGEVEWGGIAVRKGWAERERMVLSGVANNGIFPDIVHNTFCVSRDRYVFDARTLLMKRENKVLLD